MDSIFNLSVIIAAVDNLTGPVREMVRSMEGLDRMAARGREMQDWGTRMSIAGAMTQGAATQMMAAIRGPIETAAEFQEAMALVNAVTTDITQAEFEALRRQALELGAATTFSASQAAEGMGFLARAGFSAQEQMAAMPSMLSLARAGAVDLGLTADIASNILSGFGLDAAEMTRVADVMVATFTTANTDIPMLGDTMRYIAPVARAAGMSLEEAAAMAGLLGNAGIQSSQAGTTLRAMLQRLAAPSREAAETLAALGVSVADEQGNMRSMVTILGEVGDAIGGLGTQQQLGIIDTIFGVEAAAGAAELLAQGQSIGDYVDQLMASEGRAAEVAAGMADNYRGAQEEFAGALETLNIVLGDALLPMMTDLALRLADVVSGLGEWVAANPNLARIVMTIAGISAMTLAVVAPILSVVGGFAMMAGVGLQVVSRIGVAFVWLLPKIWAAMGGIFMFGARLVTVAAAAIPSFISGLVAMGAAAAGRVVAGLRAAAVAARAFGLALMANPIGLVVAAIAAAALLVWYYWEPISEFFVDLWADVQTAFEGFSSWVTGWWSRVTGWLAQGLDWARMIPSLSWADFVGLLTWENFLTVLDWLSWLIPLRWLDFIPGFSWAEVIGAVLDWADWIASLSWSEFVALFTWDNALQVLDWASWVLPIRWLDFIPGFSWSAVIGSALDWADWITSLSWSEFVALFTWDNALQVLDWVSWISPLRWLDFIPGFSWAAIIQTALDWGAWVVALDWSSYVPSFSWAGVLTALDWASWLIPLRWLDFIPGFSWAEVIGSALAWGDWITSLDWSAYLPAFSWSGALTALDWASWILPIRWLDFIPGFSWAEVMGSALAWGDWITALDWSAYVPSFDLSGAVSGAVNWLTWISPLNWLDYIPAFSWSDVLPEMPALDWSAVAAAMQAPFETAFAAITAIWDGMRALFAWSPLETIREAFGGIGETVVGIISGAADMAGAAWNRLTTIFSSGDAAEMAIRDPASIERAQAAVEALAAALGRLEGVDFAPAQAGVEAVGLAAGQSIAQAGGIPAAAEAAIRSATAVLQGVSFRSHGIAFMRTLAEGIRAGAAQAIEATRETVQAMRDHLPHSPAKVGPLSDLDRVRFSETVAGAVRPAPAVAAVHRLTAGMAAALAGATMSLPAMAAQVPEIGRTNLPVLQAASALPQVGLTGEPGSAPAMAATGAAGADAGTRVEINFNPTITMQGGAGGGDGFQSREQMQELLRSMGHELVQLVQDELARQSRRDY